MAVVAPAGSFGVLPALRCPGPRFSVAAAAAKVPRGVPLRCPSRPGSCRRCLPRSCRLRASAESAPATWTPKSGKKPLVVLVGFMGATPAIMARWSNLYEQRGIETVQVIPSLRGMLLAHQGWRGRGSAAVRDMCALIEQRSADSEVAVHIFSNNGFVFFGSCLQASPLIRERISAVILDSAPSYITPDSGATALLAAVRRVEADKAAAGLRWSLLRTAMVPVMALMDGRQSAAWGAWSSHCPRAPHLFIFSKRDKMVPPADIEAFAEEHALRVRALGRAVEVDKWETGQHCGLLRVSKTRYMQAVVRFLQDSA